MASTTFLVAFLAIATVALFVLRMISWFVVQALIAGVPAMIPRLSRSTVWTRGAPVRAHVAKRYPRFARAVSGRFGVESFTGLPLTLIAVAGLYLAASLAGLIDLIEDQHGTVLLDQSVYDFFRPYRAPWLLKGFLWITALGAGPSLTAMLLTATALLWSSGRTPAIVPVWIAFLGAQATTWSSKYLIDRPRPAFLPGITEWNPSFPSGHATAVTALIGILGTVVAATAPGLRARFEIGFWTAVIILLICFSRIFLGVHFVTDVVAGLIVGLFWLLVGYSAGALRPIRRASEN